MIKFDFILIAKLMISIFCLALYFKSSFANSLFPPYTFVKSFNIITLILDFLYSITFFCIVSTGLSELIAEARALPKKIFFEGSGTRSRMRCNSSYFGAKDLTSHIWIILGLDDSLMDLY